MKTRSRILRIALVVAIVLMCEAGTIADQLVTTNVDDTPFTADHPWIRCNKASCTQSCDSSAPATGACMDVDQHIQTASTLECCCCVGFAHTKNLRFYPF